MSRPTFIRHVVSSSDPSSVQIDCTGGNYVVAKQKRIGTGGQAWGTISYDSTQLDTILSNTGFNTHVKISGFPAPVQDEITLDITQDGASAHIVVVEVWADVNLDAPFSDPKTISGETATYALEFETVLAHEVICTLLNKSSAETGDFSPSSNLTVVATGPTIGHTYQAHYGKEEAVGTDVEVSVVKNGPTTAGRFSGFLLAGIGGPDGPVITETTRLQSGKPLVITVTDASASGNTVILSPTTDHEHEDAETQSIDAESSTEITTDPITLPDGIVAGNGLYLFVIDDDSNVSAPFPMLVSDPALRLDAVGDPESNRIVDAAGDPVTGSVSAVVMSGTAGSRSIVYDGASVSVTAGVMDIVDVAFSIDELGDPYTVMLVAGSNVACVCTASVVDRNEDE